VADSYKLITPAVARQIKAVMTDIDGTITSSAGLKRGERTFHPGVVDTLRRFEADGVTVGFVSGRNIPDLETYASALHISGPLVAENGALAKIKSGAPLFDLGFKRDTVATALQRLNALFPGAIENGQWNRTRTVDLILLLHGVTADEIRKHLTDTELLDSGYIYHLTPKGASKGNTLLRLLQQEDFRSLAPEAVMVVGDAPTDLSLFETFPLSLLILNPTIPPVTRSLLKAQARYVSDAGCVEGFVEVANYILELRNSRPK
jgi:hydroxymethylpyrimidine pyrophosphatase-like HAD family hydrolase